MDPKDLQAITEAVDTGLATVGSKFEAQLAELNESAKKILDKPEDKPEVKVEGEEKAKMEQAGIAKGITDFQVWDIPVGQALVGGFAAVFASELIDGILIQQGDWMKGMVKLVGAGASVKWGSRILGSTGSKALAILLAYDGIRSLVPIDTWARRGATTVTGMIPAGGLGGFRSNVGGKVAPGNGRGRGADYYDALKGGVN